MICVPDQTAAIILVNQAAVQIRHNIIDCVHQK